MPPEHRPFLDISMPIRSGMPGFPGDPVVQVTPVKSVQRGDAYGVSSLSLSSHSGTHVDPPSHFLPGGMTVDELDLDLLNGPCEVVDARGSERIVDRAQVARIPGGTLRVLFRTPNSERWASSPEFFPDYVGLEPAAAVELIARGVRLVGIDSLSIELDPTGTFPVHHELLGGGALILEGLQLAGVEPGPYELRFLPLRIAGGDGGPGRALLRRLGPAPA